MRRLCSPECAIPIILIVALVWGGDLVTAAWTLTDRLWDVAASVGRWWGVYF